MTTARHSILPSGKNSFDKHPYREKYYEQWSRAAQTYDLQPTVYLLEALEYHVRATKQQEANIQAWKEGLIGSDEKCGCDLQDNIRIYDTVYRWSAGFSNVSQELMLGSKNPKRVFNETHGLSFWDGDLADREQMYLLLIHRLCGSGASFASVGDSRLPPHGWYNTPVPMLYKEAGSVKDFVKILRKYDKPMFSSIGNQIPPFNKPTGTYTTGGRQYLCETAPKLVDYVCRLAAQGNLYTIQRMVDKVLQWQTDQGHRRFKFVLTAWVMDLAEYWPNFVDPNSDCYHGKNAIEAIDLCFDFKNSRPGFGKQSFYDRATRFMADEGKTRPMDVEDAAPGCDFVRWVENYIHPRGYDHVDRSNVFNCSFIRHEAGRQPWKKGTSEWIWS